MEERASWLPPPQSQGAPTKVLKEQGQGPIRSLVDLALGPLLTSGSRAQQGQPHLWWTLTLRVLWCLRVVVWWCSGISGSLHLQSWP